MNPGQTPALDLESLRRQVTEQLSALLENQSRTNIFAATISAQIARVHQEVLTDLQNAARDLAPHDAVAKRVARALERCHLLDDSLALLFAERQRRQWERNGRYLQDILKSFTTTTDYLSTTLVERDLFEKQSQVLERIILSHERVTRWKEFVLEILEGFHAIFPFDFFFIAFTEEHGLGLYVYYYGAYDAVAKRDVREQLARKMIDQLGLPHDTPLDVEEFDIDLTQKPDLDFCNIQLITVPVPEFAPKLSGLLGAAYASSLPLTLQERSIIRALLSVMVMVVGSSKVLSRTLAELEYYAVHDPLTGLHNRRHFNEMLEYELDRAERHRHTFCILLLDLDDFKDINDSYGHPTGDQTLILIAGCLKSGLRKGDLAARIGGDEFAVLLPETSQTGGVVVAQALRKRLRDLKFETADGKHYHVTASIGLVCYPHDGANAQDLWAGVDAALYHAKGRGKDEVSSLEALGQVQHARDTRQFAETLREALREERIVPYFQPIIDCRTGSIFAYESLARLIETNGETVAAGRFIETIEKYGLARDMDKAIVNQALQAAQSYQQYIGENPPRLFINLSAQEIQGRGILGYAEQLCNRMQLPPHSVVFEIMERDAIGDMMHMRKFLAQLRERGFAFALDDFGSGYNSFHYLRELYFEYVKIDGTFVRNILYSSIDRALVSNLGHLCQDLGIKTIAEFVESEAILDVLRDIGIDYAQGYYVGMPSPRLV